MLGDTVGAGFRPQAAGTTSHTPIPVSQQVSKCFRKEVSSYLSPEQPETVPLQGPGYRRGCVEKRDLNHKENSVTT